MCFLYDRVNLASGALSRSIFRQFSESGEREGTDNGMRLRCYMRLYDLAVQFPAQINNKDRAAISEAACLEVISEKKGLVLRSDQ